MRIVVIGAGQVGTTIVDALHDEHDLTIVDTDPGRLSALSYRYDVATVQGNGASRRTLQDAGVREADVLIACTSRDEVNIIASILARKLAPDAKTLVRTTDIEYLEVWHERQLDIDFIVSSELETAHAVSRILGVPAARQTDVFAEGQVQIVEFDIEDDDRDAVVVGRPLREATIPSDSKVAGIIRGGQSIVPRGDQSIEVGDRVVVIGSPAAAREWSALLARDQQRIDDIVIYGGGRAGVAIGRLLVEQGMHVRIIEADRERAREVSELLPQARVFHATGIDPDFLERERIGNVRAAIFAMRDDHKNLYAATLAKLRGVRFTIGIVHEPISASVFEAAGINVSVNPRDVTAEEMVRFAHDPRTQQVAMLEGDRFEILDITVRPESKLVNTPFRQLPMTGSLIGAIVRDGSALFPHGEDMLYPGDRVIIFTESARVPEVERRL